MGVSEAMVAIAWGTTPLVSTYLENWALALPLQVSTALLVLTILLLQIWKFPSLQKTKENERSISIDNKLMAKDITSEI